MSTSCQIIIRERNLRVVGEEVEQVTQEQEAVRQITGEAPKPPKKKYETQFALANLFKSYDGTPEAMMPFLQNWAKFAQQSVGLNVVYQSYASEMASLLIAYDYVMCVGRGDEEMTVRELGVVPRIMPLVEYRPIEYLYLIDLPSINDLDDYEKDIIRNVTTQKRILPKKNIEIKITCIQTNQPTFWTRKITEGKELNEGIVCEETIVLYEGAPPEPQKPEEKPKPSLGQCPRCGSLKYNRMRESGKYECFICGYKEGETLESELSTLFG